MKLVTIGYLDAKVAYSV